MYKPLPKNLTIQKSAIEGLGLFATADIPKKTSLGLSHIKVNGEYIRTPLGGFYNHSDNPNCETYIKGEFMFLKRVWKFNFYKYYLTSMHQVMKLIGMTQGW